MTPQALLEMRDHQVDRYQPQILNIDFQPFYKGFPVIDDSRNIGQGLAFLNRYLCDNLLTESQYWLEALFNALHLLEYDGIPLLINDRIHSGIELSQQVKQALKFLVKYSPDEPYKKIHMDLQELGFEPGWGNTVSGDVAILLIDLHLHEMIVSRIYWKMKMILQPIRCINCHGINIVKFGKTPEGKQRYKCREDSCDGRTFILDYSRPGSSRSVKKQIIDMAMNGSGVRDTARVLHVSPNTVTRELKKKNLSCSQ